MKADKQISALWAAVLSFCLSFGTTGAMVTGFRLWEDMLVLGLLCLACAAGMAVLFAVPKGRWILLGVAGAFCLLVMPGAVFREQLLGLCGQMMGFYQRAYGIEIPELFQGHMPDSYLLPLAVIAAAIAASVSWAVQKRFSPALGVFLSLVPLASCFVVTDTVPEPIFLMLWLFGLILLTVPQKLRLRDARQGHRLTGLLALPMALFLGVLAWAIPQDTYSPPIPVGNAQEFWSWMSTKLPQFGQSFDGSWVVSFGGNMSQRVELDRLEGRGDQQTPVMELRPDFTGQFYLKGKDFDCYDGTSWSSDPDRKETYLMPGSQWTEHAGRLEVRMLAKWNQQFVPYYTDGVLIYQGGEVKNEDRETDFDYTCFTLRSDWKYRGSSYLDPDQEDERYLELPDKTQAQAEAILRQNGLLSYSQLTTAEAIVSYVSRSARYDKEPERMPKDADDFAIWFLEEAESGYCVHYATAATVLLRAAGIPARYVEGYMAVAEGGQVTTVRGSMAHAWVEIYVSGVGWVVMEPTPGMTYEPPAPTEPTVTQPTEPTETTPTEPSTRPTQPTQSTQPSQTTRPSQPVTAGTQSQTTASTAGGEAPEVPLPPWVGPLVAGLCVAGVTVLAVVLQWMLRRRRKLRRMHSGSAKAQALARYGEVKLVCRLLRCPMPGHIQALADKAVFSQYELAPEELRQFDRYLAQSVARLRKQGWLKRLCYRLFWAVY